MVIKLAHHYTDRQIMLKYEHTMAFVTERVEFPGRESPAGFPPQRPIRVGNSTTPESMMGYLESMFFKMTHTHTLTHTVRFQIIHKHCVGPRFFTNTGWVCICGAVCQVIHESRGSQIWFCFVITQNT